MAYGFAFLGALAEGVTLNRRELNMACGCTYDPPFHGFVYVLMGSTCDHFRQSVDRYQRAEHRASHKRKRKACRYCQEAA